MPKLLSPGRLFLTGIALLAVVALILWLVPSGSYILLPDEAHPVAPLVHVEGERSDRDRGGIYFVDVLIRRASLLERLFPGLRDGASLVPAQAVNPPGVSESERRSSDLTEMARSQSLAAAVVLRALGYRVVARPIGALVTAVAVDAPATGKLKPSDVIVAVDGKPVRRPADLARLMAQVEPGEEVRFTARSASGLRMVTLRTVADPRDAKRARVGIGIAQAVDIRLPIGVRIDSGSIGGPSAGLAFALDLMEELGRDVDRGHRVAATGEIGLDGTIGSVGGLKQKTLGARKAGVDVFLVPAGDNAREARRYADGLRVIPVHSFRQALRALATLPKR